MPYITPERREELKTQRPANPGELNHEFTVLIVEYLKEHGLAYRTINDIVGALEGAKLEFYRRIAVPYETAKHAENGDVY